MELWIRSQNKKLLIKPKNIGIIQEGNWYDRESPLSSKYKLLYKITSENYFLGEYKSEERALEVLDEIQNILQPKYMLNSKTIKPNGDYWEENGVIFQNYTADARIEQFTTYVYEMPEE